jgi:hypothetical protein
MLDHLLSLLFDEGQLHLIEIRGFRARRGVLWRFIILILFVIFNPELEVFPEDFLEQLHVMRA